jgi:hypothetical protein
LSFYSALVFAERRLDQKLWRSLRTYLHCLFLNSKRVFVYAKWDVFKYEDK